MGRGGWAGQCQKRENGKEKWGEGDKIVDKQCTSCNVVDGYTRV